MDLLPPERPVRPRHRFPISGDVIDAEFITVVDSPRRSFDARRFNDNLRQGLQTRSEDRSTACRCAVLHTEKLLERLSNGAFAGLVATVFFAVFVLVGGLSISALQAHNTATSPALDITHVTLTPRDADGMRVLQISAVVENRAPMQLAVPPIRADLLSDGRIVASTVIAAPVAALEAGHSRGLSAKLQHGGGKTPEIRLSFLSSGAPGS